MDDSTSSFGVDALSQLADEVIEYMIRLGGERDVRKALVGSRLAESWADAMGIFTGNDPEARSLLLIIVDRMPENLRLMDFGQLLIELWLNPADPDPTVALWLREESKSNAKLRRALIGIDLEPDGP